MGESAVSWQTWSDGAASVPTIIGDQDWGQIELELDEEGRSRVYDFGDTDERTIVVTRDRYEVGQGTSTAQIRGQNTPFVQDDVSPSWENYVGPTNKTWRYIQGRSIKQS